jgi:CRP-like cAMP-binding protein
MDYSSCFLLQGLTASQIERIESVIHEQVIKKGQWLFREGQKAEHFYMVKQGAIELLDVVDDAIEIPIAMIRPKYGCLGIGALVAPYRYSVSARSNLDSILLAFNQPALKKLIRDDAEMGHRIMTNLAQKLLERLKETRQELKIHFMNLVRSATF